jgi:hypothetical protein
LGLEILLATLCDFFNPSQLKWGLFCKDGINFVMSKADLTLHQSLWHMEIDSALRIHPLHSGVAYSIIVTCFPRASCACEMSRRHRLIMFLTNSRFDRLRLLGVFCYPYDGRSERRRRGVNITVLLRIQVYEDSCGPLCETHGTSLESEF